MLIFRAENYLKKIIELISVTGEFPISALYLLGNERVVKRLVRNLSEKQIIRNDETGEEQKGKLLTVSGKGRLKTVRFYKGMLSVLNWIHEDALEFYLTSYQGHRFPGGKTHMERNHRVAEAVCMFFRAGVETRPYMLPKLQNKYRTDMVGDDPAFYLSRNLKKVGENEINKTMFSRIVGALFAGGKCYAVYNTRDAVMKWNGMGEFKTLHNLTEISRMNSKADSIDSAILFGASESIALKSLMESDKSRRLEFRFDSVYRHIYFVPLEEAGLRLIRIMCISGWRERLLQLLFDEKMRSFDLGTFEYDAKVGEAYVLSFLDGDIARLIRFRDAIRNQPGIFEVLCYPQQAAFLNAYLGESVSLRTIGIEMMERALGLENS